MSFVYFFECEGHIKVGFATDVFQRLAEVQVGSPHRVTIAGVIPGTRATEKAMHRRLAEFKHRGEWFQGRGLLWAIKEILDEHGEEMMVKIPTPSAKEDYVRKYGKHPTPRSPGYEG